MDFLITLPPDVIRKQIIDAYVADILEGNTELSNVSVIVNDLLSKGYNRLGINCLFMHETTAKFIKNKIRLKRDSEFISAAFSFPICLN